MEQCKRMYVPVGVPNVRIEDNLKERMGEIMGGKVLDLPSDQLREERKKGIEQGIEQEIEQGIGVLIHHFTTFGLRHVFKTQVFQDFTNNL